MRSGSSSTLIAAEQYGQQYATPLNFRRSLDSILISWTFTEDMEASHLGHLAAMSHSHFRLTLQRRDDTATYPFVRHLLL